MKKALAVGLVLLALAAINVGQWRTIRALQAELAAAHQQQAEQVRGQTQATEEVVRLRAHNESFKSESATLREKLQRLEPAARAAAHTAPSDPAPPRPGQQEAETQKKLAEDPKWQELQERQMRGWIADFYRDLGPELGLSPEKLQEVLELIYTRDEAMRKLAAENPKFKDPDRTRALNALLEAALGSEKFPRFENFQSTLWMRGQVKQYQQEFVADGQTLQEEQRRQLLQAVIEGRTKQLQAMAMDPQGAAAPVTDEQIHLSLSRVDEVNRMVLERARGFLTANQLSTLQRLQQRDVDRELMTLKQQQARKANPR